MFKKLLIFLIYNLYMSFTFDVKKEILNQEFSKEQGYEFISGLVASSGIHDKENTYIIKLNNSVISNFIIDMLNQMNFKFSNSLENKNWIIINNFFPQHNIKHPASFFSGIFVGGGSISDPKTTSYHLELQFFDDNLSYKVKTFLNNYGFNFTEIKRRNNWVLYIKKSELLTDFLKVVQAHDALFKFEDTRINRDFKNQLNRYSNFDLYNQKKLAKATMEFLNKYKFIVQNNLTNLFSEQEIAFFELKKNNPYSSLEDLSKKYEKKTGIFKSKSGLNHYIYKLKKIFSKNKMLK